MDRKALAGAALAVMSIALGGIAPNALADNIPTVTTITANTPNPSTPGQNVTFTATVVIPSQPGFPIPAKPFFGSADDSFVTFFSDGVQIGDPVLIMTTSFVDAPTTVTLDYAGLAPGSHAITAMFGGLLKDNYDQPSTSDPVTQVVRRIRTDLHASSTLTPNGKAVFVNFRAVLTRHDNGDPIEGENIVFRDNDGTRLCHDVTNSNGVARCRIYETVTDTPVTTFTAHFRGDELYRGSSDTSNATNPFNGYFFQH